ncbi:EF-hand domain-containing protein [Rhodosalinus halophilus]|uniref:EF-hand domain-containing protein n=1 Tax=Rhodosalinus halophilus TaxID=2259333 RepID=UPI001F1C8AB5|nr:calcium-binding protein [Rhodosalinus halophilus]
MAVLLASGAALADSGPHHGDARGAGMGGGHDMMEMIMRMHGMMGVDGAMPGMGMGVMGMPGGMGMMGPGGPMMGGMTGSPGMGMMADLDADGDGVVTPEEARTGLGSLLSEYDADGDGTLSIAEFETLHSALIRETMVDRFQHLDADGDGRITAEEMQAPAAQMQRMQGLRERMMNEGGYAPGQMMPGGGRMMDEGGPRMQGN